MSRFTSPLARATASCVAMIVCLAAATPAVAAPPTPRTTTDPAAAAAGWLAQQFDDHFDYAGGTFFDGGTTADAIFALAASRTGKSKIDAAVSYFRTHVNDYTSITDTSGQPGPYDGSVAKAATAAEVAGADPASFGGHNLLQALKVDQCTSVSAPTSDTDFTTPTCPAIGAARNIFSSISESFAILAETRGGSAYAPSDAAVSYFLSLQCADGGFTVQTVGGTGCTSDVDATGYAVAALRALGGHDSQLSNAAGWLVSQRNAAGYWTTNGGPNVDSTGLAASALAAAGISTSRSRSWLISQQVTTGPTLGTGARRGALKYQGAFDPASSVKATADGVLGLAPGVTLATLTDAAATPGTTVAALAAPTLSSHSLRRGSTGTVTGTGFSADEQVRATLASLPLAHARTSTVGSAAVHFVVPGTLASGTYRLVLTGVTSRLTSSVPLRVTAPSTGAAPSAPVSSSSPNPISTTATVGGGPALADTGQDSRTLVGELALALGLLLIGGATQLAARPRRR